MKKLFIISSLILAVGGAGAGLILWANQPSTAKISNIANPLNDVKGSATTLVDFETTYFKTKISEDLYKKTSSESIDAVTLGQYLLINKDPYKSGQLAITVSNSGGGSIQDEASVKFRKTYIQDYTESPTEAGFPIDSVVFIKNEGYEKSVFWVFEGQFASVVVSGGIEDRAELENSLRAALNNWQWK